MDATQTIEALPTADDDQTQFRGRAARPTAIKLVEDMVPRELFLGSYEYLVGICHKKLAVAPDDEHARRAFQFMNSAMGIPGKWRHKCDAIYMLAVMTEESFGTDGSPLGCYPMFLMGCKEGHAGCTERVRELTAADPPDEHFIQTLWVMQATGALTDEARSRNPTLVQAWALAEANPPPHQLQAMLAALAAQHLNAAEAAEAA